MYVGIVIALTYSLLVAGVVVRELSRQPQPPRIGDVASGVAGAVFLAGIAIIFWRESRLSPAQMSWFVRMYYERWLVGGVQGVRVMSVMFGGMAIVFFSIAAAQLYRILLMRGNAET